MKEVKGVLGELYQLFVMRDIVYIVSGMWNLFFVYYLTRSLELGDFVTLVTHTGRGFLLYIVLAYFFGLVTYLTILSTSAVDTDAKHFTKSYHKARLSLGESQDSYVARVVERSTFMQMAMYTLLASSLFSSILIIIKIVFRRAPADWYYLGSSIVLGLLFYYNGKSELDEEDSILLEFASQHKD